MSAYCPIIHGGLHIALSSNFENPRIKSCCIRNDFVLVSAYEDVWNSPTLTPLRELNKLDKWDNGCWNCQAQEKANLTSFRTGSLSKFGVRENLTGPVRLDLMFDISCNLACRTCGPALSTYWQKHLRENKISFNSTSPISQADKMIEILKTIDLSNLEMVVFCGGETLLGGSYWKVAEEIAKMVPNAKNQLTVSFQTNGTQSINPRHFETIEKFHLVKLNVSLDGIGEQFNYLRWPANWEQVVGNLSALVNELPGNVMFLVEETLSIFNLYYHNLLKDWVHNNFSKNRLGDAVDHTTHLAQGLYSLDQLTYEYVDQLPTNLKGIVNPSFRENPEKIICMFAEIKKFDSIRNQNWKNTFPELADFYSRYI